MRFFKKTTSYACALVFRFSISGRVTLETRELFFSQQWNKRKQIVKNNCSSIYYTTKENHEKPLGDHSI